MRVLKIFAVHDNAANAFSQPHSYQTTAMAIRGFGQACQDPDTMFNRHPADYTLFEIGEFSDETGAITPCTPHAVSKALDHVPSSAELKAVNDG